jgi:type II secretory pathway component PulL
MSEHTPVGESVSLKEIESALFAVRQSRGRVRSAIETLDDARTEPGRSSAHEELAVAFDSLSKAESMLSAEATRRQDNE